MFMSSIDLQEIFPIEKVLKEMLISLNQQIKKDKDLEYRRRRNERKDFGQRKRYEDYQNRRSYQSKRYNDQRTNQQQQKQCIKISNLHYEVTKEQLQSIFSQCGKLKSCRIDWDKMGRSKETATIEYFNREDEERALKELNNQILQGQSIKMEIVSQNSSYPNKRHEISKQYNTYRMNKQYRK